MSTTSPPKALSSSKRSLIALRQTSSPIIKAFPAKQQRSEETHKKLLDAGLTLLNSGSFEEISIAQIASHAGCSVGSFYLRFRNKDAYFEFLVDGLCDALRMEAQQQLTIESVKVLSLAQTVCFCVEHYIQANRKNRGLIRAALLYGMNGSDDWQPIREIGLMLTARYIELMVSKLRRPDTEAARKQLLNGLQIMSSHLINSIAHPVVELSLDHPDLCHWMYEMVMHSLKVTPSKSNYQQEKKN